MKKTFIILTSIFLLTGFVFVSSCKKKDSSAPVVTLIGDANIQHILNQPYVDLGATATDDGDPIDVTIEVNAVDINLIGVYKVIWTAVDADGNKGSAERTVTVYNEANYLIGTYNIIVIIQDSSGLKSNYEYIDKISVSGIVNNQIWVDKFNNYQSAAVNIEVDGYGLTIPNQTIPSGSPPVQRSFSGIGNIDPNTKNINIQTCIEIVTGVPEPYKIQTSSTWIKQ